MEHVDYILHGIGESTLAANYKQIITCGPEAGALLSRLRLGRGSQTYTTQSTTPRKTHLARVRRPVLSVKHLEGEMRGILRVCCCWEHQSFSVMPSAAFVATDTHSSFCRTVSALDVLAARLSRCIESSHVCGTRIRRASSVIHIRSVATAV